MQGSTPGRDTAELRHASEPKVAPAEVILGFIADYQDESPWVPTNGVGKWMSTATLRALLTAGRLTVYNFHSYVFHGHLDGAAICYTHSLFGIVGDLQEMREADQP